jgi:pimeloyl-ACP methyl ester carboxylesterase
MTSFPPAVHHTLSGANAPDGSSGGEPIRLAVHELGEGGDRPPVVFCHGFPELAYSWRHQLPALADAGFRAVAPDQRGYGGSSAPPAVADYGLGHLCGDLADLLDALEIERAVFVGHDWGGFVAWAMPVLFPDRCAGAVGVCTPYTPFPTTDFLRSMFPDPDKMYMLWFQQQDVPESVMDPRARVLFERLMIGGVDPAVLLEQQLSRPDGPDLNPFRDLDGLARVGESIVGPEELDVYASTFERTGFRGGINWYRNIDANAERYPAVGHQPLDLPTLMICAEWDPALPPALAAGMPDKCSDLEMETVARAGHWVQQEDPEEVNGFLVDWLTRRFG